jgi:hypothetical protein
LHLEICLLRVFPLIKLNKRILQRITGLLVPDYLTAHNRPKSRENEFQIFVSGDRVQLADKQYILRRADISERKIADHLQGSG